MVKQPRRNRLGFRKQQRRASLLSHFIRDARQAVEPVRARYIRPGKSPRRPPRTQEQCRRRLVLGVTFIGQEPRAWDNNKLYPRPRRGKLFGNQHRIPPELPRHKRESHARTRHAKQQLPSGT